MLGIEFEETGDIFPSEFLEDVDCQTVICGLFVGSDGSFDTLPPPPVLPRVYILPIRRYHTAFSSHDSTIIRSPLIGIGGHPRARRTVRW